MIILNLMNDEMFDKIEGQFKLGINEIQVQKFIFSILNSLRMANDLL